MIDCFTAKKQEMGPLEICQANALDFVTLNYITYLTMQSIESLKLLEKSKKTASEEEMEGIKSGINLIEKSIAEAATRIEKSLGWCA